LSPDAIQNGADLDACEREPLPFSGRIQDVGGLLAVPCGGEGVSHYSTNLGRWFDLPAAVTGQPLDAFFRDDCNYFTHRRRRVFEDRHFIIRGVVTNRGIEGDLLLAEGETHCLYEFEPRAADPSSSRTPSENLTVSVDTARVPASVPVEEALRRIHGVTAYPKLMLYRFLEDGAGEVVAELSDRQLDTYQGLRFPASDIPRIARNLYIDNPFRLIFDTRGASAALEGGGDDDAILDLSYSTLRSVSPVHVEYLGNMGVRSSASFPVRVLGRLWGLLAMHSPEPRSIPVDERLEVVQVVEQALARRLMDAHVRDNHRRFNDSVELLERGAAALQALSENPVPCERVPAPLDALLSCEALILRIDGQRVTPGQGFTDREIDTLFDLGRREAQRNQFVTDSLERHLDQSEDFRRRASGLLYAAMGGLAGSPRIELLWLRAEQAGTVTWAGRPEKVRQVIDGQERISPRKSFEAWTSEARGCSAPWTSGDQMLVSKLLVQTLILQREPGPGATHPTGQPTNS